MTDCKFKTLLGAFAVTVALCASSFGAPATAADKTARPTTDFFKKSVIYQILPQHFTQDGTIKKAAEFLPHIKSLGVDIVYFCPIVESDNDMDTRFWSKRQKASGLNNPCNPYRMKDYFKIDPRFGNDKDLKDFVEQAHALGMKVILDLVYYHCGPKAVFIETNPDFVVRDADGKVKNGKWSFPELNFKSKGLREYLIKNMEYFVEKFDVDGYRTDVEPAVPADFWAEAYNRVSKIKPDVIMIAEGERKDAQVDAYDANYSFKWEYGLINVFQGKKPASELRNIWETQHKQFAKGSRLLRALDNHDTASDACQPKMGGARFEKQFGNRGMDAIQVLNFTIDGIPFIYNGNELADDAYFSMFADNKHGRTFVAWENIATKEGWARMQLIRKLSKLHKGNTALWDGCTKWLDNSAADKIAAFTRNAKWQNMLVVVNTRNESVDATVDFNADAMTTALSYGASYKQVDGRLNVKLAPYGYLVIRYE